MSPTPKASNRHRLRSYAELPTRPWFLAPPRRISSDLDAKTLRLHTFQTARAYETLTRDGLLVGDSSRGLADFQEAYEWMLKQMEQYLAGPPDGLLWLWPNATHRLLRNVARHASGEVLLTVHVPRERMLVSDFSDWHTVLNRCLHVPRQTDESDAEWDARWQARTDAFETRCEPYVSLATSEWPTELRAELETSWEAIFDPVTWPRKPDLQATMRELRRDEVVRAVRIC